MTDRPPTDAETWLRSRYGAYRGHFAWRELEEAFNAGRGSGGTPPPAVAREDEALIRQMLSAAEALHEVRELDSADVPLEESWPEHFDALAQSIAAARTHLGTNQPEAPNVPKPVAQQGLADQQGGRDVDHPL